MISPTITGLMLFCVFHFSSELFMTLGPYRTSWILRKSQTKQNIASNEQSGLKHNTGVLGLPLAEFCGVPGSRLSSQQATFMTRVRKIPLASRQLCLRVEPFPSQQQTGTLSHLLHNVVCHRVNKN